MLSVTEMVSLVWYVVAPTRKVTGPVLAVRRGIFVTVGEGTFSGVGVAFVPPPVEPFCPQPMSCAAIMIAPAMSNNRCIHIMMIPPFIPPLDAYSGVHNY